MFKIKNERENHHVACLLTIGFVSILLVSFGTVHNAFADNVMSTISLGGKSEYLGVNPTTNKIYASLVDSSTVSVINGATNTLTGTITVKNFPHGVGVNPTTNKIYVANQNDNTVSVINGTTDSVMDTITVSNPWAIGVNPTTNKIYVAAPQNGVYVIDGKTDSVTKISGMNPNSIGVNPTTNKIYTTNALDNTISVINGTTDSVMDTITVSNPWAIGVNPTTNKIYVANIGSNIISVIDGTTNNVVTTMPVGSHPNSIGVNPTTNKIYVANAYDNTVSVIDSTTNNVVSTILVGSDPHDVGVNQITNRIYVDNFNSKTISIIDGSTTVPSNPQNFTATATSSSQINLSWSTPANNGGALVTGYVIERSTDNGSIWNTIVPNTANVDTTYFDTGLAHSTIYTYRVSAINEIGTSSPSNTASATTLNTVPTPPTNLTTTVISSSQINLSWNPPSDNGGTQVTGYKIERSTNGGNVWSTLVSNTGNADTTYSDTGLSPNTTYTYRVSAINSVGTSDPSNTASSTTPVFSAAGITVGPVGTLPLH